MLGRFYALIWLVVAISAGIFYFAGLFNPRTLIAFGFIVSTLTAMGLVVVLPWWVATRQTWDYKTGSYGK